MGNATDPPPASPGNHYGSHPPKNHHLVLIYPFCAQELLGWDMVLLVYRDIVWNRAAALDILHTSPLESIRDFIVDITTLNKNTLF